MISKYINVLKSIPTPTMNSSYVHTLVEYIDLSDCQFQYELDWYQKHGFEVHDSMMFTNYNTPACRVLANTSPDELDVDYLDIFLELTLNTYSQLDWVIDNWKDDYWSTLSYNKYMTSDKWRRILRRHRVPDEWLDNLLGSQHFPWVDIKDRCEERGVPYLYFITSNQYIIDPKRSANNDWFWDQYRDQIGISSGKFLSGNPTVSPDFWTPFIDRLDIEEAYHNPSFDEQFWTRIHQDTHTRINWNKLSQHPYLPITFWEHHIDRVNWDHLLMYNQRLTTQFLIVHIDKINWSYVICTNNHVPSDFWEIYFKARSDTIMTLDWISLCSNESVPPALLADWLTRKQGLVEWYPQCLRCPLSFWEGPMGKRKDDKRFVYENPYVIKLVMKSELCRFLSS